MLSRIKRQIHRPALDGRLLPPGMQQLIRRQQIEAFTLWSDSRVGPEQGEHAAFISDEDDAGKNNGSYDYFAHGNPKRIRQIVKAG